MRDVRDFSPRDGAGSFDSERSLTDITPRAAAVTLLLFDSVVTRYERQKGRPLSEQEQTSIQRVLKGILERECAN